MDKEKRNQLRAESDRIIMNRMGVFQIRNKVNGKILLGASSHPENKMEWIKKDLNQGKYYLRSLQEDWRQYGEKNFAFEVIDRLEPIEGQSMADAALELEVMLELWLEKLQPYGDRGYNRKPGRGN